MLPTWLEYLILCAAQSCLMKQPRDHLLAVTVLTFVFGVIEKPRKESFVLGATNSKTKKLMLQVIN